MKSKHISNLVEATLSKNPLEISPVVTGILLLMLEDDSMAVRLAGIRAMSCFGRVCRYEANA